MLNAKLILTPNPSGGYNRNIKEVEGDNSTYYTYPTEETKYVKVRPLNEQDYENLYEKLGLTSKVDKKVIELIKRNICDFDLPIAFSHVKIDGEYHSLLYFEEV